MRYVSYMLDIAEHLTNVEAEAWRADPRSTIQWANMVNQARTIVTPLAAIISELSQRTQAEQGASTPTTDVITLHNLQFKEGYSNTVLQRIVDIRYYQKPGGKCKGETR